MKISFLVLDRNPVLLPITSAKAVVGKRYTVSLFPSVVKDQKDQKR